MTRALVMALPVLARDSRGITRALVMATALGSRRRTVTWLVDAVRGGDRPADRDEDHKIGALLAVVVPVPDGDAGERRCARCGRR